MDDLLLHYLQWPVWLQSVLYAPLCNVMLCCTYDTFFAANIDMPFCMINKLKP